MQLYRNFRSLFFILIINVGVTQGMEIVPSLCQPLADVFGALSSFFPLSSHKQKSKKPHNQKLIKIKNDFEQVINTFKNDTGLLEKTKLSMLSTLSNENYDHYFFNAKVKPLLVKATNDSTSFLLYCYYQKNHDDWDRTDIDYLIKPEHAELLKKCKEAHIDGFSALGAAIAAKDITIETKRNFIQKLMNCGFELTEKDTLLAAAELHDEILTQQETGVLSLLLGQGNFAILPEDVRRCIMESMIDVFKITLWPCPTKL